MVIWDPHAASNNSNERHNRPHQIFFKVKAPFQLHAPLLLNVLQSVARIVRLHACLITHLVLLWE